MSTVTPREQLLSHSLEPYLPALARIARRGQLLRDPLYHRLKHEIDRVVAGLEWRLEPPSPSPNVAHGRLRAVAWNIERGKRFDGIKALLVEHPALRDADIVMLSEVDIGMNRSGGRNVARELAAAMGMSYVYANGYLLLSPGDKGEKTNEWPTGLSLHGNALLSRFPIVRWEGVALGEFKDKFHAFEKRLGEKRAIVAELALPDGPMTVAVVHTDPFAPPKHRARQVKRVLAAIEKFGHHRVLLGGDLNTNTWNLGGPFRVAVDMAHKVVRLGVDQSIAEYMTPWRTFERGLFDALTEHGLRLDGLNDFSQATIYYDLQDEALMAKSRQYIPGVAIRYLERRLRPWNGRVPMRIDWFAGRGLAPAPGHMPGTEHACHTLDRPTWGGEPVSDHEPILVDIALSR